MPADRPTIELKATLATRKISFRTGGFITGFIGMLMLPGKLVADPNGYSFVWLIA